MKNLSLLSSLTIVSQKDGNGDNNCEIINNKISGKKIKLEISRTQIIGFLLY
jgi:hypothetical protein